MEAPEEESFDLADVTDKDLFEELIIRFIELEQREKKIERLREILHCSARIAFGDFTDLPRLKLLFNDANVYGASPAQLELLLNRE